MAEALPCEALFSSIAMVKAPPSEALFLWHCWVLVTKLDDLLNMLAETGAGDHLFGKSAEKIVIEKY